MSNIKKLLSLRTILGTFFAISVFLAWKLYEVAKLPDIDAMLDVSVSIKTISHVRTDPVGDSVWHSSTGSGFLVSAEPCEVWTNNHVVEDAAVIEVFPRGQASYAGIPARIFRATPRSDLAVLHMARCQGMRAAVLGNSDLVQQGEEVYAVGNPLGRHPDSVSRGIVSHTERYVSGPTTPHLQTDASINRGHSGGALFDNNSRVIGINTALATNERGGHSGISYAVPINHARRVIERLHQGPPSWGEAGIEDVLSDLTSDQAVLFGVPEGRSAVIVTATPEEGPSAGKLLAHDVIYAIDDVVVSGRDQAVRLIGEGRPGETVRFAVLRDGEHYLVDVVLREGFDSENVSSAEPYDGHLGMTLEMWQREENGPDRFDTPVITRVQSLGPAHRAHIASSQQTIAISGPFITRYQLDVKAITGAVFMGQYEPIMTPEQIEAMAARAYEMGEPILLEIAVWVRTGSGGPNAKLEYVRTAFHTVMPEPSAEILAVLGGR